MLNILDASSDSKLILHHSPGFDTFWPLRVDSGSVLGGMRPKALLLGRIEQ